MLIVVALALLLGLALLRRLVEPTCPSCGSKRWGSGSGALHCVDCGWTNATAPESAVDEPQIELTLPG